MDFVTLYTAAFLYEFFLFFECEHICLQCNIFYYHSSRSVLVLAGWVAAFFRFTVFTATGGAFECSGVSTADQK